MSASIIFKQLKFVKTALLITKSVLQKPGSTIRQHRCVSNYVSRIRHLQSLKEDDKLCQRALDGAKYAVYYGLRPLVQEEGDCGFKLAWFDKAEIKERLNLDVESQDLALLNCHNGGGSSSTADNSSDHFAVNIPEDPARYKERRDEIQTALGAIDMNMRKAILVAPQQEADLISQGHAYLQWHNKHQFCSNCGSRTHPNIAGNKRICKSCSETSFPVMSPVAITLVTAENQCLIARQPQFPKGMYSALAGFCEPGETLNDAVRREVAEEVGLDVDTVTFYSTQHWPFPSSALMLACHAAITPGSTTQFSLDTNEIEDARWLHKDEAKDILGIAGGKEPEGDPIWFPPPQAIAHHLLRSWALL